MQHLDEGTIHAWLDGALAPNEASAAEAHVQSCEECARAVAEARGLIAASSRILGALDDVPAVQNTTGALSLPAARLRRRPSWLRRGGIGYAAAATALLAVGTTLVWSRMSPDTAMDARVTANEAAPAPVAATSQALSDSVASKRAAESRPPAADLARDAVADTKNVPAVTSAKLSAKVSERAKESQPPKEELAKDIVVPLPGAMPRPAAPKSTPPVRQEAERKALAEAAGNAALSARPAQVLGRVLDATTGAPVAGAIVSIDTARAAVRTDSAGKFQLQSVPLGNQTVSVRALGFQAAQHRVAVAQSDSVQLAFALQKSGVELQPVVVTGAAQRAQQDKREEPNARRDAPQSRAGQEGVRFRASSGAAASAAGCYTLRAVTQDKARDEDRAIVASLPTRVQLESELVDRSRANEQSASRARTVAGGARAESWRMVGDSLEVTLVDGDRRMALRFARRDTRWISDIAIMERCGTP